MRIRSEGASDGRDGVANEPLVHEVEPIGWIDPRVVAEADAEITRQSRPWGPLDRHG